MFVREKCRNQRPELQGEILEAYIGSAITGGKGLLDASAVVLFYVKAWNKIQMPQIVVLRYELKIVIQGPDGKQTLTGTRGKGYINLIPESAQSAIQAFNIEHAGLKPQLYLYPQKDYIGFFVRRLSWETREFTSVEITLIDAAGGKHPLRAENLPCKPHLQGLQIEE